MRLRIRYTKVGKLRFIGHRDLARLWERALRRARLPVAYTEGFSPHPKLHFGLALPTTYESWAEYLDVDLDLDSTLVPVDVLEHLGSSLPSGVEPVAWGVLGPGEPSLQQAVVSCTWKLMVAGAPPPAVAERVSQLVEAATLPITRERKGRQTTEDVRPQLWALRVIGDGEEGVELEAELATQPRGLRPRELMGIMGPGLEERRVIRMNQWTMPDGTRREPLSWPQQPETRTEPGLPRASHAEARAS